jgi:hypothetical protein
MRSASCLDPPHPLGDENAAIDGDIGGGSPSLGLCRVQWQADDRNTASIRAATRMGFRGEGTIRWHRYLPTGKSGSLSRPTDFKLECAGRHSALHMLERMGGW